MAACSATHRKSVSLSIEQLSNQSTRAQGSSQSHRLKLMTDIQPNRTVNHMYVRMIVIEK